MDNARSLSVTEFLQDCNGDLASNFAGVCISGEVSGHKVNQGKWVFFDLKDDQSSLSCFLPVWEQRIPLEDGMKIIVQGTPKVTPWGKFSFTVKNMKPVGEGSLKKAFEMLKKKLAKEGLFDPAKKREIPKPLTKIGVISSTGAAGYKDFVKILNERWGGMTVQVAHTQVQGISAPDQIMRALKFFNEQAEVQMIAILRGGGSADDLAAFNDEQLARAIAASRIPIITGIGHEQDESLADLAADVRASTPSNAAQMLTPDRNEIIDHLLRTTNQMHGLMSKHINQISMQNMEKIRDARDHIQSQLEQSLQHVAHQQQILESFNPDQVLKRGYAIISGKISSGSVVNITTSDKLIKAEVKNVKRRS